MIYNPPERVRIVSSAIGGLAYGRSRDDCFVVGQAGGFAAAESIDPAHWCFQREGRATAYGPGYATRADAMTALDQHLADERRIRARDAQLVKLRAASPMRSKSRAVHDVDGLALFDHARQPSLF